MKNKFTILLLLLGLVSFAQTPLSKKIYTITSSGGVEVIAPMQYPQLVVLQPEDDDVVLADNYSIQFSSSPVSGAHWTVILNPLLDLDGHVMNIFGVLPTQAQLDNNIPYIYQFWQTTSGDYQYSVQPYDFTQAAIISGATLIDASVPLDKLESGTSAQLIIGDGSGVPTYQSITGDIAVSNSGVTSISSGVIVNADINASAAIARSKLAAGTANTIVTNDGSGVLSSTSTIPLANGGFGVDVSASVGLFAFTGGGTSIGALNDVRDKFVQFGTTSTGTYLMYFSFPCTIVGARAVVSDEIENSDDATITLQDAGGTPMTGGVITLTAGATTGDVFTCTPTTGTSVSAGTAIRLISAKATAGGNANVEILYTRLTLE